MNLRKQIFTKNRCYTAGKKIIPKGIMVHSTGANNPALKRYVGPDDGVLGVNKHGNHWNRAFFPGKCSHAFIGKLENGSVATYQVLPWDHRGWHTGGKANDTHISLEICEDDLHDAIYFGKVYLEAAQLCAHLCKLYSLTENDIIDHAEGHAARIASNHGDVAHWFLRFDKSMDTFRADVKALLAGQKPKEETLVQVIPDAAKSFKSSLSGTYQVTAKSGLYLRAGASTSKAIVELMPRDSRVKCYGYHTGSWLYVVSDSGKTGFCAKGYLKKV